MSKNIEKFKEILRESYDPSTDAQFALYCLCETFLDEDQYDTIPESHEQANTAILCNILYKYNKHFRKWVKRQRKIHSGE